MEPNARLLPFLRSNYPVPDDLQPFLIAQYNKLAQSISDLDGEITQVNKTLDSLLQKKAVLLNKKQALQPLKSPIRRLPVELVPTIMRFATEERDKPFNGIELKAFAKLRAVCGYWRAVALSTPSLWRSLQVDLGAWGDYRDPQTAVTNFTERLNACFTLAGRGSSLQLSFTVGVTPAQGKLDFSEVLSFLSGSTQINLASLAFDVHVLDFDSRDNVSTLLDNSLRPWESTRNLTLGVAASSTLLHMNPLSTAFPQLESLFLDNVNVFNTLGEINFTHPHLCSLQLNNIPMPSSKFASFVCGLPALQELILAECDWGAYRVDRGEPFTHPSLQRLILIECCVPPLISSLTLPSLNLFRLVGSGVECTNDEYAEYADDIGLFVERCDPIHLTLSLEHSAAPSWFIPRLLTKIHVLHRLHIRDYIVFPLKSPMPVPSSVQEIVCTTTPTQSSEVLEWARSLETGHLPREQTLKVYVPRCIPPGDGEELQEGWCELQQSGVELHSLPMANLEAMLLYPTAVRCHDYDRLIQRYCVLPESSKSESVPKA